MTDRTATRPAQTGASLLGSFFRGWRPLVQGVALGLGLTLSSTAVLAYADLLQRGFDLDLTGAATAEAVSADPAAAPTLPGVAARLAAGESLRIVAFGSSSTQGVGASAPAHSYPARLEARLRRALPQGASVLNRGIGGEAVDEMLARLERDVIAPRPDLVIWQTGSNDPLRGVSLAHFTEETATAVRRIRAAGIDVVLMEPQWCPRLDATPGAYRFRDAVREIGDALGVPVIRRSTLMRDWIANGDLTQAELFSADGLHMADRGYALLAEAAAADILRGARASRRPPLWPSPRRSEGHWSEGQARRLHGRPSPAIAATSPEPTGSRPGA